MNLQQLQPQRYIGYGRAYLVAMMPAGNVLAVGTTAGIVWVDLPTMQVMRFDETSEPENILNSIVFSPNGQQMATTWNETSSPETRISRSADGEYQATVQGITPVFSPDGQFVATSLQDAESGEYTTWIWNTNDGAKHATLVGSAPQFSPDGEMICTVQDVESATPATLLWRVEDGALLRDLAGRSPAFSPDNAWLANAKGNKVQLWDLREGGAASTQVIEPDLSNETLSFSPDGQELRILDNGLHIWEREGETIVSHMSVNGIPGTSDEVLVHFLNSGEGMLLGLQLIRVADGAILYEDAEVLFSDQIYDNERRLVSFNHDGSLAAFVTVNGLVRFVNLVTGETNDLNLPSYTSVAFNHDGQLLATGSNGPVVDLWRTSNGVLQQHKVASWGMSYNRKPFALRFSHDGRWLAVEEDIEQYGAAISVAATTWTMDSGSTGFEAWSLTEMDSMSFPFGKEHWTFSPAVQTAAWVNRNNQVVMKRGEESARVVADPGSFTALEFSDNGSLLAISQQNGTIQLLRGDTGFLFDTVEAGGEVHALTFSPDATLLGAHRADGILVVWRVGEKQPIANIITGGIDRFLFTTSNQMLITSSSEGVTFYRISDSQMVRHLNIGAVQDIAIEPVQWYLAVLQHERVSLWGISQ
jgi:WD40 repeat protein